MTEGFIPNKVLEPGVEPAMTAASAGAGNPFANYLVPGGLLVAIVLALFWLQARNKAAQEKPVVAKTTDVAGAGSASAGSGGPPYVNVVPPGNYDSLSPSHPEPTAPDPRGGKFGISEATEGMPAGTTLHADIETSMGTIACELFPNKAPNTVANFVGLATGRREFWDPVAGNWTKRPYYDGSIFHRVIPDFMIQGGDILRMGGGGPGYKFADENPAPHNEAGLLCMANAGPGTNGSQFFVMEGPKDSLDGTYSIFGKCGPIDLVKAIARVKANAANRPDQPVVIKHITVRR